MAKKTTELPKKTRKPRVTKRDDGNGHGGKGGLESEEKGRLSLGQAALLGLDDGGESPDGASTIPQEALDQMEGLMEIGFDSLSTGQKLGVLQRIITAVVEDKQYRQVLTMAAFDNKQEAQLCADCIAELKRYGVPITPVIDRIIAQCSVKAGRVNSVLTALTHYSISQNYSGRLPDWKRRQNNRGLSGGNIL